MRLDKYLTDCFLGTRKEAKTLIKKGLIKVNDKIMINGELHSREYKKVYENGELELRVAHELLVNEFEVVNEI